MIPADAAQPTDDTASLSPEEIRRTLHELRVHQVELEQQNEALRKDNERLQAAQRVAGVESFDGDLLTKENIGQPTASRTQRRTCASSGLLSVRKVARKEKRTRFGNLCGFRLGRVRAS